MNEEAFGQLYEQFVQTGYEGGREEFIQLMSSNDEAFTQGFKAFTSTGYNGGREEFATLVGVIDPLTVKKKEEIVVEEEVSPLPSADEDGPSPYLAHEFDTPRITEAKRLINEFDAESWRLGKEVDAKWREKLGLTGEQTNHEGDGSDGQWMAEWEQTLNREMVGPNGEDLQEAFDIANETPTEAEELKDVARKRYQENINREESGRPLLPAWEYSANYNPDVASNEEMEAAMAEVGTKTEIELSNQQYEENKFVNLTNMSKDMQNFDVNVNQLTEELKDFNFTRAINRDDNSRTIKSLNNEWGRYGLVFTDSFFGGSMIVTTIDGQNSLDVDLDPFTNASAVESGIELENFILGNANPLDRERAEKNDFEAKAQRAQNIRTGRRINENGTVSTHLMATYEEDGKFIVAPTLFPKDDDNQSKYASAWDELSGAEALTRAKERNEVFYFETQEEANEFAMGSWKDVSLVDIVANNFYNERGLDYQAASTIYNEYQEVRDEILWIDEMQLTNLVGSEKGNKTKKYGHLYTNGFVRQDLVAYKEELIRRRDNLNLNTDEAKIRLAREDFDVILEKEYVKKAKKAFKVGTEVKDKLKVLNKESLLEFQSTIPNLPKALAAKPDILQEKKNLASKLYVSYLDNMLERKLAKDMYEHADLYFNRKENKTVGMDGYEDNEMLGFWNEGRKGAAQGDALNSILQFTTGVDLFDYGSDTVDPDDIMSVAQAIVNSVEDKAQIGDTRTMLAWNEAQTNQEIWNVIQNDPFEWALQLSANSIGQMLEYGSQIVPISGVVGAGVGGTIGATGFVTGPGGVVTTAGGAVTGFGYGLRTGFAATAYAMEYTNSVFEAINEHGYDITDVNSVAEALLDEEMWADASARGHARGIPIAIVSFFTAGLAGKILSRTNPALNARGVGNIVLALGGEATVGAGGEAVSEIAAQASEIFFETGRTSMDGKEIVAEVGGGLGTTSSNLLINKHTINRRNARMDFFNNLTNPEFLANYNEATDTEVLNFINKMVKNGNLSEVKGQNVRLNLALKKTATDMLADEDAKKTDVVARMMRLLNAKQVLEGDNTNNKELFKNFYGPKLKEINQEISDILFSGEVKDNQTNLEEGIASAQIDKIKRFDRTAPTFRVGNTTTENEEKFLKKISKLTDYNQPISFQVNDNPKLAAKINKIVSEKLNELKITEAKKMGISLDPSQLIKIDTDANTQQETVQVVDGKQTIVSKKVAEGVTGQPQETTEQSEESKELTDLEKARNGDVEIQQNFEKYGIDWEFKPTYRYVGQSEFDALQNEETIEGKNPSFGVDVTSSDKVTTATDNEYRITYKKDVIDRALPDSKLRMKNEVDGHIRGGYTMADVSLIERINPDGTYETVYQVLDIKAVESETAVESEVDAESVDDANALLDSDESVEFRLKDESVTEPSREEVENITEEINALESDNVNVKIERDEESVSIDVNELNNRTDNKLNETSFDVVNDLPTSFTISDQLTTGNTTNPNTGNTIDNLKGAIGFNGTEGNENAAWASTNEKTAQGMINKAQKIYNNNKEVYDKFWQENPDYNGLVMVNVVKMAEDGIVSNEAMFRVLADNITKLPVENRVKALEALKNEIIGKRDKAVKKKPFDDIIALLESDNINSIDDVVAPAFVDKLGLTARANLMKIIGYGNVNKPNETKNPGTIAKSSTVTRALMENQDKSNNKLVNIGSIAEIITDPQLKNVPELSIIGIVGVDVLNPEVLKSNHPNYPFAPKGKSIGVLSNPVAMEKAYPIAYEKALGSLLEKEQKPSKKKVKGKTVKKPSTKVTGKQLRTNQTGIGIGIPSKDYIGALAKNNQGNVNKLVNFLNKSFPSVMMSVDPEVFARVLAEPGTQKYLKGNEVIYGMTKDGDIYINPDVHTNKSSLYNTAIHEMGHIWTDYLQTTAKGRKLYNRGVELVKKTAEYKRQLKKFDGDAKKAADETMAILIGNKGETIVNATLFSKFQEWLFGMWKYIKSQFKMSQDLTEEEIQDMNLDTFIGTALADIFAGKEISLNDIQKKALKNPELAFKKGLNAQDIIYKLRGAGFPDNAINEVLQTRLKISKGLATTLMAEEQTALFNMDVPPAFANIEGGINAGREILTELNTVREARQVQEQREGKVTNAKTERAARLVEIKENAKFNKLNELDQQNLIVAYDKLLGSKAGVESQNEINKILTELKGRKKQEKLSLTTRNKLKNVIKALIPKSDNITKTTLEKLSKRMAEVNETNFQAKVAEVAKIASEINVRDIRDARNDIQKYVDSKKNPKLSNKKPIAGTIEYEGVALFQAVDKVLNSTEVELAAMQTAMDENETAIDDARAKYLKGEQLTLDEVNLLASFEALARVGNINFLNLEQMIDLKKSLTEDAKESRDKLFKRRDARKKETDRIAEKFDKSIAENNPFLFKDGRPMTKSEIENNQKNILSELRTNGFTGMVSNYVEQFLGGYSQIGTSKNPFAAIVRFANTIVGHTGMFYNMLDGAFGENVFTKYFQNNLAKADYNREQGVREANDAFDEIAKNSGIKKGRIVGLPQEVYKINPIKFDNLNPTKENPSGVSLTLGPFMMMGVYAASRNADTLFDMQSKQGVTNEMLAKIEEALGQNILDYINQSIDYLTNESFDKINEVHIRNRDVSLIKIDKYFPKAIDFSRTRFTEEEALQMGGNPISNFRANSPANIKKRTKGAPIDLKANFESTLQNYIEQTERYKAYSDTVSLFNQLLKNDSIKALLYALGADSLNSKLLNYSVNGSVAFQKNNNDSLINYFVGGFIQYILNLKPIQVIKQMSSAIMGIQNISNTDGILGYFGRVREAGGVAGLAAQIPATVVDVLTWTARYTQVLAASIVGSEKGIKNAVRISAGFEKRMKDAMRGASLTELESGQTIGGNVVVDISDNILKYIFKIPGLNKVEMTPKQVGQKISAFIGAGTTTGDILGVLGYLATYNQDIANGMTEQEATMRFITYNMTQQSRRDMDKGGLQRDAGLLKIFTTFASTMLLQLNQNAMNSRNINRGLRRALKDVRNGEFQKVVEGKYVFKEDVRGLLLSGFLANAAFTAAAYLVMILRGDDEEKEKAYKAIQRTKYGLTQMEELPILGTAYIYMVHYLETGKRPSPYDVQSGGVDPLTRIIKEVIKGVEEGSYVKAVQPLAEFRVGFQFDPIEGAINLLLGEENSEEALYDLLGIPPSYRPRSGKSNSKNKKKPKKMNLKWLKENEPDIYEQLQERKRKIQELKENK